MSIAFTRPASTDAVKVIVSDAATAEVLGEYDLIDNYLVLFTGRWFVAQTEQNANGATTITMQRLPGDD